MAKNGTDRMIRARILLAGIGARRGAATMLFLVGVIAVAAAAIGPMFLQSADTSVLTSTANAAPVGQSDLIIIANGGASQMTALSAATKLAEQRGHGLLSPALTSVDVASHFTFKGQAYSSDILARSDLCGHLHFLHGGCPRKVNDVALSQRSATLAHIGVGATLHLVEPRSSQSLEVTVAGIYAPPATVDNNYWKDENYFDYGTGTSTNIILDPLLGSFSTALGASRLDTPQLAADLAWRSGATLSGTSVIESTAATVKSTVFSRYGLVVTTSLPLVLDAARHDDNLMSTVVLAIVLQLILLSLLILYSLGRSSIAERRQESEFARRHGFPRSALIGLAIGEPAALIVMAFPVGLLLAWGTLAVLTKTLFVAGTPVSFPTIAILSAVGACVAGLIAMTVASSDLWRSRASSRRQIAGVAVVVDSLAVALTVIGLLELLSKSSLSASRADTLALLAPGMLTLGATLLGLRLVGLSVKGLIARTGDTTHVAWFLALRQIGRRPTTLRRLLPLAAATAVLLFAVSSFFLNSSNRALVAHFEVGAAKVVDVTPPPGLNFEAAVRRADPTGREAMAAAYYSSVTGDMLAVDSSRLAAVAFWPSGVSRKPLATLAHQLSPPAPHGVSFTGSELRLTLDVPKGTPSIELGVSLFDETYQTSQTIYIRPVTGGIHSYFVSLTGVCFAQCRLTGLAPNWNNPYTSTHKDVSFGLDGVSVQRGGSWHPVAFGEGQRGTWRAQPSSIGVASSGSAVVFQIPGQQLGLSGLLLSPIDLPAAMPGVVTRVAQTADAPPSPLPDGDIDIDLGGGLVTVHPVALTSTLPSVGHAGVLVDFKLAQRAATSTEDYRTFEVWLAPGASPAILNRLRADGVAIGAVTSAAVRLGQLDHGGIALAYAVALIVTPIAGLLAIGSVAFVIISDGRRRRRETASLWMAGVPLRTVRRAQALETTIVLGSALVVGAVIGFVTDSLALSSLPQFVAGSGGLSISRSVPLVPFVCAVGVFGVLLAGAVVVSTRLVMGDRHARHDSGFME
jgi:putative ABC transport system permease protein